MISPLRRGGLGAARARMSRPTRRAGLAVTSLEGRQLLAAAIASPSVPVAPASASMEPTADEQYMLQLVNRARANPQAEAQRLLALANSDPTLKAAVAGWDLSAFARQMDSYSPLPPLAFNTRLAAAATAHDAAMVAENSQFHSPAGSLARPTTPDQDAPDGQPYYPTGNSSWATAENIFAYSANLPDAHGTALDNYFHAAFLLDWGNPEFGHLKNLMAPGPGEASPGTYPMAEIGIGIVTDASPTTAPPAVAAMPGNQGLNVGPALVTQEFGWRSGHEFLTGAIFNDSNGDSFYEPGEGLGGVGIQAVGTHSEGTFSTTTWGSGGYSLDLPAGTYTVTASGAGLASPRTTTITIGQDNVGWDVIQAPAGGPPIAVAPVLASPAATAGTPQSSSSGTVAVAPPETASVATSTKGKHHPAKAHPQPTPHPKPPKHPRHR